MNADGIAEILRQEIELGALPAGARLQQEDVAQRFGVSRHPVRHALDRLTMEGLLSHQPDRTLVVSGLAEREQIHIAEVRVMLESEALRQSFPTITPRLLRRAQRLAEELAEEDNPLRMEELDIAFHALLYSGSPNARLGRLIDSLRREGRRSYHSQIKDQRQRYADDHDALLAACARKDLTEALTVLARHLIHAHLQKGEY
jgi:DNA-binding GntR family transcriptional regulator